MESIKLLKCVFRHVVQPCFVPILWNCLHQYLDLLIFILVKFSESKHISYYVKKLCFWKLNRSVFTFYAGYSICIDEIYNFGKIGSRKTSVDGFNIAIFISKFLVRPNIGFNQKTWKDIEIWDSKLSYDIIHLCKILLILIR